MVSFGPIVSYMVGKLEKRGFFWCKARIFGDYHLGYRILLTLWQQSLHYSLDLVLIPTYHFSILSNISKSHLLYFKFFVSDLISDLISAHGNNKLIRGE